MSRDGEDGNDFVEVAEPPVAGQYQQNRADEMALAASGAMAGTECLGIFLEEVAFFLEDMQCDLWWLLRAALQSNGDALIKGNEEFPEVDGSVKDQIDQIQQRAVKHAEEHANQVRAKITIIPFCTPEDRELLHALRKLRFHCGGKIEVFVCMKEANNTAIWAAYHNSVATQEPQWQVKTDGSTQKILFAQCAIIVPVYVDVEKQEIKLLNVWCPGKKQRHWAFPGGDILRGVDTSLYDTARRRWKDEVGCCFGREWANCFNEPLPEAGDQDVDSKNATMYTTLEKDGFRYPARPHFFVHVTQDFYDATRFHEDAAGVIRLPMPEGDVVRWDDLSSSQRLHLEGARFLEHDEARWLNLEYSTGRLGGDDNRQLRRENAELLKARPEKLWTCDRSDFFERLGAFFVGSIADSPH